METIKRIVLAGILTGLIALVGCKPPQDIEVERETVDLAFPIFTSETTLSDLISKGQDSNALVIFDDDRMGLLYETGMDIPIQIPDLPDADISLVYPETVISEVTAPGVLIKEAHIESGQLRLFFENNDTPENVAVSITADKLTKNGVPFQQDLLITYSGTFPARVEAYFDLDGYTLDMKHGPLTITYAATNQNGQTVPLNLALFSPRDVKMNFIDGIWDNQVIALDIPNLNIGFFDHYPDNGTVTFTDPTIDFTINNSVGLPAKMNLDHIVATTIHGDLINFTGHLTENGFGIGHPDINHIGDWVVSQATMDKSNSNIVAVTEALPTHLSLSQTSVELCPQGQSEGFMTKDAGMKLHIQAKLPFEGKVTDFRVTKKFGVHFSTDDRIKSAAIKFQAHNQIPLNARIQLYFKDEAGIILDSLVASNGVMVIDAAKVDPDGQVIQASDWQEEIPISAERWERIKPATEVILTTTFASTSEGQVPVIIKKGQGVILNAGLKLVALP